jgi:uncharacterized protein (TIRG00374 family)
MTSARTLRWRDPRVWLGVAFTVIFVWLALRDVPFAEVGRVIARANWLVLFGISLPAYPVLLWFRALRWRHLTDPIQPIGKGPLVRAVSVGFMANNIFPLRMGEVVRCWYLSRETGASGAALFGTVILERVVDTVCVIFMVFLVIAIWGGGGEGELAWGAFLLLPVAILPIVSLAILRAAPDRVLALVAVVLRPFPDRLAELVNGLLRRFSEGLGALSGGRHLFWVAVHSVIIWLVISVFPIVAAFLSLGIEFDSPFQALGAAWVTQAAVGVAVALPSAPGFFGIFHAACRFALERFGVAPETAVAAGTLIHGVMWLMLTGLGLAVLRFRRTSLGEVEEAVGGSREPSSR